MKDNVTNKTSETEAKTAAVLGAGNFKEGIGANGSRQGSLSVKNSRMRLLLLNMVGFILAGTNTYGFNPVGIGYMAALNISKGSAMLSVLALMIGMSVNFTRIAVFKNATILISTIIVFKLLSIGRLKLNENVAAAITGALMFIMETTDYMMTHSLRNPTRTFYINMVIIFGMALLSALLCIMFRKAVSTVMYARHTFANDEMLGFSLMAGLLIYSLGVNYSMPVWGVEIAAFFMILYAAYKYGIGMGALMGVACAIPVSLWNHDMNYLGVICLMGIMVGLFRELGRIASVTTMLMIGLLCFYAILPDVQVSTEAVNNIMKGMLGACVIFLMLPKSIIYRYEENVNKDENDSIKRMCEERLLNVAKTFEQMSKSLFGTQENGMIYKIENAVPEEKESEGSMAKADKTKGGVSEEILEEDKQKGAVSKDISDEIWRNRLNESRSIMSEQFEQISKIIEDYSKQIYDFVRVESEQEEYIRHKLKAKKVYMDKIVGLENKRNRKEYLVTAKCSRGATVGSREIAEVISEALGKKYIPSKNCRKLISTEFTTTTYVEEANFYVVHAAAKKARGDSGISGDNYSLRELENGHLLMGLSDGMGYGTSACIESETVIELLEQLLDSGFDAECALKMINSVMVMNMNEDHPATLDYGVIDLHSGMCDMVKLGAAATFVKRGNWVETIKSTSMPLGIFTNIDYDSTTKKLYSGDMIIMVSDGVIDAMNCENKDEKLGEIISGIEYTNPKEMADAILNRAVADKTKLSDDMTVLVTEIWENSRNAA